MTNYAAMLRGINIGGRNAVKMEALRRACSAAGLLDARTYLQSGNVAFRHAGGDARDIEVELRGLMEEKFGLDITVIVRTEEELARVVEGLPFGERDPERLHVTFLSESPSSFPRERVEGSRQGTEEYRLSGREVYLYCPYGYGGTKLSNSFFESALRVSATTRNWKTVNAVLAMTRA